MTTLKIKVTKEHIRDGVCVSVTKCAVARAVRDIFPYATVDGARISVYSSDPVIDPDAKHIGLIRLPKEVSQFITHFDQTAWTANSRDDLKEIEFEVNLPDSILESINIEEIKALLKDHPTLAIA